MLSPNFLIIIFLIICAALLCLALYRGNKIFEIKLGIILVLLAATITYTSYFSFFSLYPKDAFYKSTEDSKPLKSYTHWHEIFHYYLGGKYFKELGYNGLYEVVLLADSKSLKPEATKTHIRSLREPTYPITREQALKRAEEEFLPNFSAQRWQEFKGDVEALKNVQAKGWLDLALFDAGYNPPPTWAVFGSNLANIIPIQQELAAFEGRPNWYQLEFLPLFDLAMLIILTIVIYRCFGLLSLGVFLSLFLTSHVAGMGWTSGSLLRYTWFFSLGMGVIYLIKGKYEIAAVFLAISTMDRIFPIIFAVGAGLNLLFTYLKTIKTEDFKRLLNYSISFIITSLILFSISALQFGIDSWKGFASKIEGHNSMFFVHHIGYKRLAVFDAEITPRQNFWWQDGLDRFRNWNDNLNQKWQENKNFHYAIFALLIAACLICVSFITIAESALLFGGLMLYLLAIPANYYYIYFPLIALVFVNLKYNKINYYLLLSPFILWLYIRFVLHVSRDDLIQNYYICAGFLAFFVNWIVIRSVEIINKKAPEIVQQEIEIQRLN